MLCFLESELIYNNTPKNNSLINFQDSQISFNKINNYDEENNFFSNNSFYSNNNPMFGNRFYNKFFNDNDYVKFLNSKNSASFYNSNTNGFNFPGENIKKEFNMEYNNSFSNYFSNNMNNFQIQHQQSMLIKH